MKPLQILFFLLPLLVAVVAPEVRASVNECNNTTGMIRYVLVKQDYFTNGNLTSSTTCEHHLSYGQCIVINDYYQSGPGYWIENRYEHLHSYYYSANFISSVSINGPGGTQIGTIGNGGSIELPISPTLENVLKILNASGVPITNPNVVWKITLPGQTTPALTISSSVLDLVNVLQQLGSLTLNICVAIGTDQPFCFTLRIIETNVDEVSFAANGTNFYTLKNDADTATFSAPHYLDANRDGDGLDTNDRSYPVAYLRGTSPRMSGKIKLGASIGSQTVKVKATGPNGLSIPETTATVSGGDLITLPATSFTGTLPNTIAYYDHAVANQEFLLNWSIKIGSGSWNGIGKTRHSVFVTFGAPSTAARQESLFALGCKNASGHTNQYSAVEAIWADFTDRKVYRRGTSSPMWYYGPKTIITNGVVSPVCRTYQYLLKEGDGSCGAWAQLFGQILRAQGVSTGTTTAVLYSVTPRDIPNFSGIFLDGNTLLIKYWVFPTPPALPSASTRIPAQGPNSDSPKAFSDHAVVGIGAKIYDPSYGITANDALAYENAAFAGFEYKKPDGSLLLTNNPTNVQDVNWAIESWPQ